MLAKFAEAFRIWWRNLPLLSAIALTVALPDNILFAWVEQTYGATDEWRSLRVSMQFGAVFGPISLGALMLALYRIKSGAAITYGQAIGAGLRNWIPLMLARVIAGIITLLGLLALIIPGLHLLVRWAFLSEAIVLEGRGRDAFARSSELTAGRRWAIFNAGLVFVLAFFLGFFIIWIPPMVLGIDENIYVDVILTSIMDIVFVILQIVIFLFYWEARQAEAPVWEAVEVTMEPGEGEMPGGASYP